MMKHIWMKTLLLLCAFVATTSAQAAVDSYRFMHVTISTPWYIFIFLLMGVFAPFILMAVLAWTSAVRKSKSTEADPERKSSVE
jgi:uncharacterized membrane protein YadS